MGTTDLVDVVAALSLDESIRHCWIAHCHSSDLELDGAAAVADDPVDIRMAAADSIDCLVGVHTDLDIVVGGGCYHDSSCSSLKCVFS